MFKKFFVQTSSTQAVPYTLGGQDSFFINTPAKTTRKPGGKNAQKKPKIAQQYPAKNIQTAVIIVLFPSLKTNTTQPKQTSKHGTRITTGLRFKHLNRNQKNQKV